jgi:hypothetical protein
VGVLCILSILSVFPSDLPGVNSATLNRILLYYRLMTKWSGLGDSTELSRMGLSQAFSESDGKPRFEEAFNKIRFATSCLSWNFNKRLNPISLDRFIYPIYLCYLRSLVD